MYTSFKNERINLNTLWRSFPFFYDLKPIFSGKRGKIFLFKIYVVSILKKALQVYLWNLICHSILLVYGHFIIIFGNKS